MLCEKAGNGEQFVKMRKVISFGAVFALVTHTRKWPYERYLISAPIKEIGSYVSGKLFTYPSPEPTFCPN